VDIRPFDGTRGRRGISQFEAGSCGWKHKCPTPLFRT
jgi:hypothetical protein